MGIDELRRVISGYRLLTLDTMVFSYHLSNHPRYAPLTSVVLKAIESGQVAGLITTVTLAEILWCPWTWPWRGRRHRSVPHPDCGYQMRCKSRRHGCRARTGS